LDFGELSRTAEAKSVAMRSPVFRGKAKPLEISRKFQGLKYRKSNVPLLALWISRCLALREQKRKEKGMRREVTYCSGAIYLHKNPCAQNALKTLRFFEEERK